MGHWTTGTDRKVIAVGPMRAMACHEDCSSLRPFECMPFLPCFLRVLAIASADAGENRRRLVEWLLGSNRHTHKPCSGPPWASPAYQRRNHDHGCLCGVAGWRHGSGQGMVHEQGAVHPGSKSAGKVMGGNGSPWRHAHADATGTRGSTCHPCMNECRAHSRCAAGRSSVIRHPPTQGAP